jgi:prepilin-type N-terminal cleavage/methylation domain-containing protein
MIRINRKGFTLVEIMIVVAIIALLAAIAIPNLLSAKKTANTAAAKANVRALSTAAEVYATGHDGKYPPDVTELGKYITPAGTLCDAAKQPIQGFTYVCTYVTATDPGYSFVATPASDTSGDKKFTVTTGGVIEEETYPPATP